MRSGKRARVKILSTLFVFFVFGAVLLQLGPQVPNINRVFSPASKESSPVLKPKNEPVSVIFDNTTIEKSSTGSVLGGTMWWEKYDMSCFQKKGVNGCQLTWGGKPIVLRNLMFSKQHRGLHIFDGVNTVIKAKNEIGTDSSGKPIYETETFKYCDTSGEKYESLAMINLGPISYPTTLMGQALSTFRVTGEEVKEPQYAVIDPTGQLFTNFKPADVIKFCNTDDKIRSNVLRTITTYNSKLPGYNLGDQMGYALTALCKVLSPDPEAREKQIEQLWQTEDVNVKTVAVMVEVENNLGMVDPKFHDEIEQGGLLMGVSPQGGEDYIGMYAWQTTGALYARIPNTTGASRLLTSLMLPPNKVVPYDIEEVKESRDVQPSGKESSSLVSAPAITMFHQYENSKETIVGAVSGGVYYMEESVLKDDKNLAMLSWNPKTQDNDTFFCTVKGNEKRCPVVRTISGCSGEGFAQTDIRLRQLTLAAVNDTQRWVTFTDTDNVVRMTVRPEQLIADAQQAPDPLIEKANIDELILASGKGSVVCLDSAQKRMESAPPNLTEEEMKQLSTRLSRPGYRDQAILVSPVRVNYRSWALYDVDKGVQQECYDWADDDSQCDKMDPDDNGYNVKMVQKWDPNKYILKPALISFNIATYYRGLNGMSPDDPRAIHFEEDLKRTLAASKIHEYRDAKVDCALNVYATVDYWICSETKGLFLPKCQDGVTKNTDN